MDKLFKENLDRVATENGVSISEIMACIQEEVIDVLWSSNDEEVIAKRNAEFPNGKPSPAEYLAKLGE